MAGNRLFFPVQAVVFYSGKEWDKLETAAQTEGSYILTDYEFDNPPLFAHGVQDVSMTSNFTLTPVFELGQAAIYENVEGVPTVEITLSKVVDGHPLLWHLATMDAQQPGLMGRINAYCTFQLGLWPDTEERCFWNGVDSVGIGADLNNVVTPGMTGPVAGRSVTPIGVITCPKCYPSSIGYTISTTESATENMTLSGNEKVWARAVQSLKPIPGSPGVANDSTDVRFQALSHTVWQGNVSGSVETNDDTPDVRIAQGYNVMLTTLMTPDPTFGAGTNRDSNGAIRDPDCSVFPIEIPGITMWGTNDVVANLHEHQNPPPKGSTPRPERAYDPDPGFARVQSVSFNVSLTRNDINALGFKMPVFRSVQLPIQVTTEITVISTTDDGIQVSAFSSACQNTSALRPSTIRLALCTGAEPWVSDAASNGVRIYTGKQNKLTSVAFGQGGTGGGNVQATYSYQTNNEFTVLAKSDPTYAAIAGNWWNNRADIIAPAEVV